MNHGWRLKPRYSGGVLVSRPSKARSLHRCTPSTSTSRAHCWRLKRLGSGGRESEDLDQIAPLFRSRHAASAALSSGFSPGSFKSPIVVIGT